MTAGAAGAAAGGAAGAIAAARARRRRARRLRNRGADEIYVVINKPVERAGKLIAGLVHGWYYQDKKIMEEHRLIDFEGAAMGYLLGGFIYLFGSMFYDATQGFADVNYLFSKKYFINMAATCLIPAVWNGFRWGGDQNIGYISLRDLGTKTGVFIQVYDDDGLRNIHEDRLFRLLNVLGVRE